MKIPNLQSTYTIEQVRQLLEWAQGTPKTLMDVHNAIRPGSILEHTYIGRGAYDRRAVNAVMAAIARRRLAKELGRTSPRLIELDYAIDCPTCGGVAVRWGGRWKCVEGHEGEEVRT